ncbi:unnamed protein product [Prorocentrum cordatum]|uniref:Subtilisin n=1 Tax=Prorocentrum cordatum TaxID=2364126 RepID=A0ABN9UVU5_9DINO|nr:unnamed protein product [Polarella glacialis]
MARLVCANGSTQPWCITNRIDEKGNRHQTKEEEEEEEEEEGGPDAGSSREGRRHRHRRRPLHHRPVGEDSGGMWPAVACTAAPRARGGAFKKEGPAELLLLLLLLLACGRATAHLPSPPSPPRRGSREDRLVTLRALSEEPRQNLA